MHLFYAEPGVSIFQFLKTCTQLIRDWSSNLPREVLAHYVKKEVLAHYVKKEVLAHVHARDVEFYVCHVSVYMHG
jgi:hypothetical protein